VERTVTDGDGHTIKVANLAPGDTFGEWSLTTGSARETTVTALTDVVAYRLPREAFLAALSRHPELAAQIAHQIAERRTLLEEAIQHLSEDVAQRRSSDNVNTVLEGLRRLFGV
jgi:CRP-like cAMP-binding protein